jgi:hypothetical protein
MGASRIVEFTLSIEDLGEKQDTGPTRISVGGGQPIATWSTYVETQLAGSSQGPETASLCSGRRGILRGTESR